MANPLVTGAKALIKGSDEASQAARKTADGFSDEALSGMAASVEYAKTLPPVTQDLKLSTNQAKDKSLLGYSPSFRPKEPYYKSSEDAFEDTRRHFLDNFPEDATRQELMDEISVLPKQVRDLVKALDRDDWLGYEYPSQALNDLILDGVEGYDISSGTKSALGKLVSASQQGKLGATVVGTTALGGSLISEEAKAAPLEMQEFNSLLLDQEGQDSDVTYNEMITQRQQAADEYEFEQLVGETSAIEDIGKGIVETPLQIVGGVADAVNETLDLTKELGDWLNENVVDLGGVIWDEDGLRLASGKEISEVDNIQIPTTEKAGTTTGNIVRGISQFVTGFVGAGKLAPLKGIQPATTAGRIGKASGQGSIADFTVFDPHEERLSDLVEEFPALKNPVTAYLAADPTDNAAEGRFKNAIEGLGLGVIGDAAIEGLTKGLKAIGAARKGKAAVDSAGLGEKTGERFDPDITPEDIEAAINGDTFKAAPPAKEGEVLRADIDLTKTVQEKEGELFVNWGRIDAPEDVKSVMRDMADSMKPEIDEARRGQQTFEQIQLNAEGVDAWDTLQSRREGQPLNAEESLAARELWARSADNLSRVSKEAALNPTPQNLMAFRKMAAVHNSIQKEVISARTETARALASWRIPTSNMKMDDIEQILSLGGGSEGAREMAQRVADLSEQGMIKELDSFIEKSVLAKSTDAIKQAFYFSLLSGPKTHLRNIAGAVSSITQQVYERKAANLIGQALGDTNIADGEAWSMIAGVTRGVREAFVASSKGKRLLKQAKQLKDEGKIVEAEKVIEGAGADIGTLRKYVATGKSGWGTGKVDETQLGAFDPSVWNQQKESFIGRGLSLINNVTMTPMHALGVMDEMFTTIGSRMEINAQAVRRASAEVNEGKIPSNQLKDRIQELIDSPDAAMSESAREFAKTITFTNQPENTRAWTAFKSIGKFPVVGTVIMPFTRTPFNIAKYTFERTPMAPLVKQWRDDMAAGGARADLAIAKTATGSMIMLAMADIAMNGDITGEGPSDFKEREQLRRTGWQPNSIRVPQEDGSYKYFSVAGMEPFSTPLMLASNMVEIMQNSDIGDQDVAVEQAWMAATMAVANQVTSQQYMSGVSGFFEMMSDPQRYGASWANRLGGAVVPTGVAEVTRSMDPYARMAYDMGDTIKRRTPGLSKDLPLNTDVWGQPVTYRSDMGALYDAISPSYVSSTSKAQPIDIELNRLEKYIAKPSKKANFDGVSINLRKYPHAYADLVKLSNSLTKTRYGAPIDVGGDNMLETLNNLVEGEHPLSQIYEMMTDGSDGGKAQMIQGIVTKFQNAAKQKVLEEHDDVKAEFDMKQSQKNTKYNFTKGIQ